MFGWVEGVRLRSGDMGARIFDLAEGVRTFGREQAARIFGWGGAEVEERAKLLDRMVVLIVHGLRTKTYEQFVAAFSNPGHEPDALQRLSHKASFQMRISPTCWSRRQHRLCPRRDAIITHDWQAAMTSVFA